jgi:hypothetical protein
MHNPSKKELFLPFWVEEAFWYYFGLRDHQDFPSMFSQALAKSTEAYSLCVSTGSSSTRQSVGLHHLVYVAMIAVMSRDVKGCQG